MSARIGYEEFASLAPGARKALTALGAAVDESGLDKGLTELIKLRASQITGCAFCIQFHLNMARKAGVALKVETIEPVPSSTFPTPARRPLNSRLDTSKLRSAFDLSLPRWQDGVERMLNEILPEKP